MLIGEYESKIGDKKRTAIPKKIREELGEQIIITRGYEKCLVLINKRLWEKVAGEVISGSFINKNIRDTSRFLVGSAVEVAPDEQGRVIIPARLHQYAKLKRDLVYVGLVNWVEVWDRAEWEKRLAYLAKHGEEIAEQLTNATHDKR